MVGVLLAALLAAHAGAAANIARVPARVPARVAPALGAPSVGVSWSGGTLSPAALGQARLAPALSGKTAPSVQLGLRAGSAAERTAAAAATYPQEYGIRTAVDDSANAEAPSPDYSRERFAAPDYAEVPAAEGSARAAARAQQTLNPPVASSVDAQNASLSSLFDGSKPLPSGDMVLARAAGKGLSLEILAHAISDAGSLSAALDALRGTGVLAAEERGDEARARLMLLRVWHSVAGSVPAEPLVVEAAGVAYHIHPIVHGQGVPLRSRAVRGLVARLQDAGAALLSEQDLGRFYGFSYGLETRDHEAAGGAAAEVRPQPARAPRAILWAALLGPLALLVWRFLYGRLARAAGREGDADLAHWLRARARALFSRRFDWADARRTELPAALTLEEGGWTATRSVSMAAAAAVLSAARGLSELHLLVGHKHAQQIAALLSRGPRPRA